MSVEKREQKRKETKAKFVRFLSILGQNVRFVSLFINFVE